jgi:type IV pilus assembly protein PilC
MKEVKAEPKIEKFKPENVSLSGTDKLSLISNLSTMLTAGIPILEAVDSIREDSKGNPKKVLQTLSDDLKQGKRVWSTLEKFPLIFDKVTVNIIKASEEAGTLDVTLKDLIINIKKETEFADKIRSAMIYPAFIMVVFVGLMLMILTVVVPKISTVFSRLNVELPLPTKIMIFLSNLILKNTLPLAIVVAVLVVGFIFLYKRYRRYMVRALYSLPLVSRLAREIDTTRFTRSLFLLLSSGIPITTALELSQAVVVKKEVGQAIMHSKDLVSSGKKLSEGFKDSKNIFPSIMIKITEAGEKSGSLDKAMQDASDFLDYQVSGTLKTVTALIEPLMLVLVGIMIGGMMLAIIAPIYGLIGQVGNH